MSRLLIQIFTVFTIFIGLSQGVKRLRFHPDTITIWSDNVFLNFSYGLDISVPYANISFNVLKQIDDLESHVDAIITMKNDQKHYATVNATYSICNVLALKNIHPVAMLAFATLKAKANIPDNCPIPVNNYSATRFWVPEENIPTHIPEVHIDIHFKMWAVNSGVSTMILNCTLEGHAVYKDVDPAQMSFPGLG